MTDTKPEENKKPKALQLAEWFETSPNTRDKQGAAELRRLHEVNAKLLKALKALIDMDVAYQRGEKVVQAVEGARAAIAKASIVKATGDQA